MKPTSKQTYKVIRATLRLKKFTQYRISREEKVTFSLVNRVVNWLVAQGYAAKRKGYYEIVSPAGILGIFPIFRRMRPCAVFDVELRREEALALLKGRAALCLASALSYYDNYARDDAVYAYVLDGKVIGELKGLPRGYTHIELYWEDLNGEDFEKRGSNALTSKIRTIIDLFCSKRAYVCERLVKREWAL